MPALSQTHSFLCNDFIAFHPLIHLLYRLLSPAGVSENECKRDSVRVEGLISGDESLKKG